ncbi:MAG: tagatose 1,6-diphosphate aldolase [Chloroflexi bacterium]|nr:tagatose 1,6-diphosphate aldolase [Chloroflexota bacterium]
MPAISIGKLRGLQQCATPRGGFAVMALDHRNNLRHAFQPDSPEPASDTEITLFKGEVVDALAPVASAVLLDPELSAAQCIASQRLPGRTGLIVALEATGYVGDPQARQSQVLPGWSVAQAKRMGASAAKLLVYYHPDSPKAGEIEALVMQVAAECVAYELALFLEPLSYSLDPARKNVPPEDRRRVVIETARRLIVPGVDVLKAEFPLDISAEPDEREWRSACEELSQTSRVPWVLLSASASYETYVRQVTVACQAGASGVAAGRAVWQEAPTLNVAARESFLRTTAAGRMLRLTELVDALARPWMEFFAVPVVTPQWYASY